MSVNAAALGFNRTGGTPPPLGRARAMGMKPTARDFRVQGNAVGVIADRVMFKADSTSPEAPFKNGVVWMLRRLDGRLAWRGFSDANGYYTATRLEVGVEYIAVGIDPYGNHKATGAGPVVARAA